ncbi:MAG: cysteine dioxygenase [Nocardioidaceae bacterium]|nr:cysteine dioxygenase [Nocardioidaceae bacterium]
MTLTVDQPTPTPSADVCAEPDSLDALVASLPERDLTQDELLTIAQRLAERPHLWRDLVAFDDDRRHFVQLHRDGHVDIWLLCWTPVNDTGWHDHDVSSGAVAVAGGALVEHDLVLGGESNERVVTTGGSWAFGPDHIHRMTGLDDRSVSVHAYSPPLWRMGQYTADGGVLRRVSRSYADELRPID